MSKTDLLAVDTRAAVQKLAWVRLQTDVTWLPYITTHNLLDEKKGVELEVHPLGVLMRAKDGKCAIIPMANVKCMELK